MADPFDLSTSETAKEEAAAEAHRDELRALLKRARLRPLNREEVLRALFLIDLFTEDEWTEQDTTTH
jgi:hypothetical protein